MGGRQAGDVGGRGAKGRGNVDRNPHAGEQARDLGHVVAVAKAKRGGPQDVAADRRRPRLRTGKVADDLVEGLVGAEVFLALVGREVERDHRDAEVERLGEAPGVVLDEFGGAGGADDDGFGREACDGIAGGVLEECRGIGAKVARLEGRVGDRRTVVAPFDHGEEEVGIGVALWRVQDVMQALHRGGDPHRADMRGALVSPDGQLHAADPACRMALRRSGRENSPARSPACS